jgi:mersacidin/lichenicidin family type 2 lantibiotic
MKKELIIRAWKDPEYRARLSPEERAALPESPSGRALTELDEAELLGAVGGKRGHNYSVDTFRCAAPTFNCQETANSCGIVACEPPLY